jgi:hypothetical protein
MCIRDRNSIGLLQVRLEILTDLQRKDMDKINMKKKPFSIPFS